MDYEDQAARLRHGWVAAGSLRWYSELGAQIIDASGDGMRRTRKIECTARCEPYVSE